MSENVVNASATAEIQTPSVGAPPSALNVQGIAKLLRAYPIRFCPCFGGRDVPERDEKVKMGFVNAVSQPAPEASNDRNHSCGRL